MKMKQGTRKLIVPPGMENLVERFHYAPGVLIGDTLYVSGQVGRDENLKVIEDTREQFSQAFRNVGKVLSAAGFEYSDIVELETWFTNFPGDLAIFMQVKDEFLGGTTPTWTGFGVSSFSMPGIVCEIKVTAVKGA
jgi:enamine deaminase RidA (YjgF/YER057c/UK114 family)